MRRREEMGAKLATGNGMTEGRKEGLFWLIVRLRHRGRSVRAPSYPLVPPNRAAVCCRF